MITILLSALALQPIDLSVDLAEFRLRFSNYPAQVYLVDESSMPEVDDGVSKQCRAAHAYCQLLDSRIYINEKFWRSGNQWQKRKVLYHELGHCVLGLDHPINPAEPTIMNSVLATANSDGWNWESLVDELEERSRLTDSNSLVVSALLVEPQAPGQR
jgi:hypothetical protein